MFRLLETTMDKGAEGRQVQSGGFERRYQDGQHLNATHAGCGFEATLDSGRSSRGRTERFFEGAACRPGD